jgi:hypothetical protein
MGTFKSLQGWEATRDTLHRYAGIPSVIEAGHLDKHPKWWHLSLLVEENGLTSHRFPVGEEAYRITLDLRAHELQIFRNGSVLTTFELTAGTPASLMGQAAISVLRDQGLDGEYVTQKFDDHAPRAYDLAHAETYLDTLTQVDALFKQHKARLDGETSPVQLWAHHFDLSVELFGTRQVAYEEDGETTFYPAQLNLGFAPGDETHAAPYFYSNPFPFEAERLLDITLPHGARWVTEGFKGSLLPYETLVDDSDAGDKLLEYVDAVYQAARPLVFE